MDPVSAHQLGGTHPHLALGYLGISILRSGGPSEWGGAKRRCFCSEIRSFEKRIFGEVGEVALKRDFGC